MADILKPMLATSSTGAGGKHPVDLRTLVDAGDWVLDTKLDGMRALISPDGTIYNRKGADVTHKFPEIVLPGPRRDFWLDGELVADDTKFESVLIRESQEKRSVIMRMVIEHPVRFVAFDIVHPNLAVPWLYSQRRVALTELNSWGIDVTPYSEDYDFFEMTRSLGMEGVIAKRKTSRYRPGARSTDWIKFKNTRRITCIACGYWPGSGSRAHFGAMKLALIKGTEVVEVGRVGSGFTERQTHEMKARLDRGEFFAVEIEVLGRTSGNQLRHPVFRGAPADRDLNDARFEQMLELNQS